MLPWEASAKLEAQSSHGGSYAPCGVGRKAWGGGIKRQERQNTQSICSGGNLSPRAAVSRNHGVAPTTRRRVGAVSHYRCACVRHCASVWRGARCPVLWGCDQVRRGWTVGCLCAGRWPGGAGTGTVRGAGEARLTRLVPTPARGSGCAVDMVHALPPG